MRPGARVKLTGPGIEGPYIVEEIGEDGRVVLVPDAAEHHANEELFESTEDFLAALDREPAADEP